MEALRFGILCDGLRLTKWQLRCLAHLESLPDVSLELLILREGDSAPSPVGRVQRGPRSPDGSLLLRLYSRRFSAARSLEEVDVSERLAQVSRIDCRVRSEDGHSQYFSAEDVDAIRAYDLDFILHFGFGIIRGEILEAARYGVWSVHHGDEEKYRGAPHCFWEIYHDEPVTGAILQRLTDRPDAGIVLKKGCFATALHSLSANVDRVCFGSVAWPAQVCIDLRNGAAEYLQARPSPTMAPTYGRPTNLQMLRFAGKVVRNQLALRWQNLFRHTEWNTGIVRAPIHLFLEPEKLPAVEWLPGHRRGTFVADPFGIAGEECLDILYEYLPHKGAPRGVIRHTRLEGNGKASEPRASLEFPVHTSYPYLFEHEGEIYCVPETAEAREATLFKAERFPDRWIRMGTLLKDVAATDSTLFRHEGRWWLACADQDQDPNLCLFLWHAPELLGPWKPHAGNPVKTDVRSARPAGTPFVHEGALYRPAQDCSTGYGARVVFNRVLKLTPTEFEEVAAGSFAPDPAGPFPDGTHTVSAVGALTLIDGKRYLFYGPAFWVRLRKLVGRRS